MLTRGHVCNDFPYWYERAFRWRDYAEARFWCTVPSALARSAPNAYWNSSQVQLPTPPSCKSWTCTTPASTPADVGLGPREAARDRLSPARCAVSQNIPSCDLLLHCGRCGPKPAAYAAPSRRRNCASRWYYVLEWAVINGSPTGFEDHWRVEDPDFTVEASYEARALPDKPRPLPRAHAHRGPGRNAAGDIEQHALGHESMLEDFCARSDQWHYCGTWNNWDFSQELASNSLGERPISILRRRSGPQ